MEKITHQGDLHEYPNGGHLGHAQQRFAWHYECHDRNCAIVDCMEHRLNPSSQVQPKTAELTIELARALLRRGEIKERDVILRLRTLISKNRQQPRLQIVSQDDAS